MFDNLQPERPVFRFNWSINPDADLYYPASKAHGALPAGHDLSLERTFARVERQTLRRLPVTGDILFTVYGDGTPHVDLLQWDSRVRSTVLKNAKDTVLTPSGHLVFVRDGTLMAAPFDARQRTAGQPIALPESVSIDSELYETPQLAVSSTGTMAYVPADADTERPGIGWVNRAGEFQEVGRLPRRAQAVAQFRNHPCHAADEALFIV